MTATAPVRKLLILGGTGFVGRALCETLARRQATARTHPTGPDTAAASGRTLPPSALPPGLRLVVPTRHLPKGREVQMLPCVDLVQADVHDEAALAGLLAGCDAVVNLVAILHGSDAAFEAVHVALPRKLAAACRAAGVRRLVHVSALGVAEDAPSRYLRSKARGEAVLREAAAHGALDLTLLRPSVIFGAGDRFLNLFARLQALAPVLPLAGADARFQPVWVEDVAQAIATCLARPASIGQTYECAGPEVQTLAELVRLAGQASGHVRPILPLPAALAQLQAGLMELLPGEPLMSRDNLASMQVPNIASGTLPGLDALGITAQPAAAVAPTYLQPHPRCARLDALRARHW